MEGEICIFYKDIYLKIANNKADAQYKIYYYEKALEALQKIKGNNHHEEIQKLKYDIQELKPLIIRGMKKYRLPLMNITKEVQESAAKISNISLGEALIVLATNMPWLSEKHATRNMGQDLLDILPVICYTEEGLKRNTSLLPIKNQQYIKLYYQFGFFYPYIFPVLTEIRKKYFLLEEMFLPMMINHPFVPAGYEKLYAKGICYYLKGDYIESASILIPLFENSLRHLVHICFPTFYSKKENIEEYTISIDDLIDKCVKLKLIDNDLAFNIRYFFCKNDVNFRNDYAHGLFKFQNFSNPLLLVALSLIYYVLMIPFIRHDKDNFHNDSLLSE
ncbi:MAG: DUF4209 domain-containing protein [Alphaproteobacteria bacterium]|nr:DUF4209 domain-containing protein [Alphaproteobacteria bacterium]